MNKRRSDRVALYGKHLSARRENTAVYIAPIASLILAFCCSVSFAADKTFQFEPADNLSFVEAMTMRKAITMGSNPPQIWRHETQGRYTIRKTDDGWSIYVKPVKPLDMDTAADVSALANSILANISFRYDLDDNGELVNIDGIEAAMAEVNALFPPEYRSLLSAMGLSADMIQQQAAARWQMLGLFDMRNANGYTVTLDQARQVEAVYPSVMGGAFKTEGTAVFRGPQSCGENESCYEFTSAGTSQDPNIGQAMANMLNNMLQGGIAEAAAIEGMETPVIPEFSITGAEENVTMSRIFSERTGLQHQYIQHHDVTGRMHVRGESVDESEVFRFEINYTHRFEFD